MALIKDKKQPVSGYGEKNPNTLNVQPDKVGDLFVNTATKTLYFSFGLAGTQWGTAGTA